MEMQIFFDGKKQVNAEWNGQVIKTDQPVQGGGEGTAPTPFDLFLASIGTCAGIYVKGFCDQRGLSSEEIKIIQKLNFNPSTRLIDKIDLTSPKLHISLDGVIALKDIDEQYLRKGGVGTLRKEEEVFDIGPETIKIFKKVISDAKTILWNGPLGMYEDKRFEVGTKEIASAIVRNYSALKIAGGGDTVAAIHKFDLAEKFDFISTGGGAMLEFLTGEELVGIEALN